MIDQIKRLQRQLELKRKYRRVFGTPEGQEVLIDIMRRSGVTTPRFELDPQTLTFHEGQRHLALSIFRYVHKTDAEERLASTMEAELKQEEAQ